jgi:hypothetical protein
LSCLAGCIVYGDPHDAVCTSHLQIARPRCWLRGAIGGVPLHVATVVDVAVGRRAGRRINHSAERQHHLLLFGLRSGPPRGGPSLFERACLWHAREQRLQRYRLDADFRRHAEAEPAMCGFAKDAAVLFFQPSCGGRGGATGSIRPAGLLVTSTGRIKIKKKVFLNRMYVS